MCPARPWSQSRVGRRDVQQLGQLPKIRCDLVGLEFDTAPGHPAVAHARVHEGQALRTWSPFQSVHQSAWVTCSWEAVQEWIERASPVASGPNTSIGESRADRRNTDPHSRTCPRHGHRREGLKSPGPPYGADLCVALRRSCGVVPGQTSKGRTPEGRGRSEVISGFAVLASPRVRIAASAFASRDCPSGRCLPTVQAPEQTGALWGLPAIDRGR
jgi:hypothetical protein